MKRIILSNLFFLFLLTLTVFCIYGKAINFGYTNLDDDELTYKNIDYISNIKNIPNLFIKDCYYGHNSLYYRPILNLSFSIESIFFKDDSKIYHSTNILLYIIALFIIFVFLSELNFNKTILKIFILLFAVHPILSSLPVWIPARNDTLLTIFFLSSLINFIRYIKTYKTKYLILHFLFFFLSLFSKETTVLLIFIYPLLIYCFNLKTNKKQILNNLFFIVPLLIFYFILRFFSVQYISLTTYFINSQYYIKNIVTGIMLYIYKIIYPTDMPIMLYNIKLNLHIYILNTIVFLLLIFICYRKIINNRIVIFALSFSFLSILPTFFQNEYAFLTHRIIICLPGIFIILLLICEKLILKYPKIKIYLTVIFIFTFCLFSFCSFIQTEKYKESFTFWNNAYKNASNYHLVCSGLAKELIYIKNNDKAIELLFEAKKIKNIYDYDLDICTALISKGDLNKAKERLLRMTKLKDDFLTFRYLSEIFYIQGDLEKSKIYVDKAMKINPTDNVILNHYKKLTDALNGKK